MTDEIKVLHFAQGTPVSPPTVNPPISLKVNKFITVEQIDSTTSGANATSEVNTKSIMTFTNAGLVSLAEVPGADKSQLLIVINQTGADREIVNGSGILTGTGENLPWPSGAAVFMAFIESLDDWLVVGGSGSGGGGASQKNYTLTNNQSTIANVAGFLLNSTLYSSYYGYLEIERLGAVKYRQLIEVKIIWDETTWQLLLGGYGGNDLIVPTIANPQEIELTVDNTGQFSYKTGNLSGHTKSTIKASLTGIKK